MARSKTKTAKKVSLADIADMVGFSTATISRVINNSSQVCPTTRTSVLKALNEHQLISPAGNTGSNVVGVVINDFHKNRLLNMYDRDCIAGIFEGAFYCHLQTIPIDIITQKTSTESYIECIQRSGVNALIYLGYLQTNESAIREISEAGFPQVVLGGRLDYPRVSWIDVENVQSTCNAIKYLCDLGHKRIAIMAGSPNAADHAQRLEGYKLALKECGIQLDPALIMHRYHISIKTGISATHELLMKANRPTAIFYTNGELAMGGLQACRQLKIGVPEDISIISFDDSCLPEYLTPPLTYIRQPAFEIGRSALQIIANYFKHQANEVVHEEIIPDFMIRESTAKVKS